MSRPIQIIRHISVFLFVFVSVFSLINGGVVMSAGCNQDKGIYPAESTNPRICRGGDDACKAKIPDTICAFKSKLVDYTSYAQAPQPSDYPADIIGPRPRFRPSMADPILMGPPVRIGIVRCTCIPDPAKHPTGSN